MSYQQRNVTVALVTHLLIAAYFVINWLTMYTTGGLVDKKVFGLWLTVIIATIAVTIFGTILASIVGAIVHAVKTRSDKPEQFIEDERDKLIDLKGTRVSYITFSIGVGLAMLSFVLKQPALIMFSIIILFSLLAEIAGDISKLVRYQKGV
jgi:uncharacterized membrane protein